MNSLLSREKEVVVELATEGFKIASPVDHEQLAARLSSVASEIASDIGAALAELGGSSIHGKVTLKVDGVKATSEDA